MKPPNANPRRGNPHRPPAHTVPTMVSVNSGDGPGSVVTNSFALPVALRALGAAGEEPQPFTLEVVPPPGENGRFIPALAGSGDLSSRGVPSSPR